MKLTQEQRKRLVVGILACAIAAAAFIFLNPKPQPPAKDPNDHSFYYKGPMKGRGMSQSVGTDELNPDIVGGGPTTLSNTNK